MSTPGDFFTIKAFNMKQSDLKRLALLMAVNCVRNTVIENYHAQGKLNDSEMAAFNREVADKIYTFLSFTFTKPMEDREAFLGVMDVMYPTKWDQPKIDRDFAGAVKLFKKRRSRLREDLPDEA